MPCPSSVDAAKDCFLARFFLPARWFLLFFVLVVAVVSGLSVAVERLSPSPPWIAVGSGLRGASELLESAGVDRGGGAAMIAGLYEYSIVMKLCATSIWRCRSKEDAIAGLQKHLMLVGKLIGYDFRRNARCKICDDAGSLRIR